VTQRCSAEKGDSARKTGFHPSWKTLDTFRCDRASIVAVSSRALRQRRLHWHRLPKRRRRKETGETSPGRGQHRRLEISPVRRRSSQSADPVHPETERRLGRSARRTRRRLRRRPAAPPGGSERTFASAIEPAAQLTTNLVPSNRLNGARIEVPNPEGDFGSPGCFGVFVDLRLKTVNERAGDCGPCRRGQFQSVR
jgi:hypothetical protein